MKKYYTKYYYYVLSTITLACLYTLVYNYFKIYSSFNPLQKLKKKVKGLQGTDALLQGKDIQIENQAVKID